MSESTPQAKQIVRSAPAVAVLAPKMVEPAAPEVGVGDVIGGRYRLEELLGSGGMGKVFVAVNTAIGLRVAVKLLRPDMLSGELRRRFQQEAQAVAAIQHLNVARFLDLVIGDPTFLVMEHVPGEPLSRILEREGRLSSTRAVALARQLCWGLDAAHAAGVIHRDLKPGNIMVASDGERGELGKLIDWGLAKVPLTGSDDTQLTRAGQVLGTPCYMAPEQIRGKEVDARADVYSLGCVLYQMIAGRPPFVTTGDDLQLMFRQVNELPEPLSRHVADVSPALDALLAKALAKDPADRFASAREMADALAHSVERRRRNPSGPAKAMPAARRWLWPVVVALVAAAAFALGRKLTLARPPAAARELVTVSSEPQGASVEVDGRRLAEPTPTALRGLGPGPHVVTLRLAGHDDVVRHLDMAKGDRLALNVTLPPKSRTLVVRTVPSGAAVFLDGHLAAPVSPASLALPVDEFHEIRAELPGYEPYDQRLTPDDTAGELELVLEPEREPRGQLSVDSNGIAEVLVDGVPTGFLAPTTALRIAVGPHTVELTDSTGRRSPVVKVDIKQGDHIHLMLDVR